MFRSQDQQFFHLPEVSRMRSKVFEDSFDFYFNDLPERSTATMVKKDVGQWAKFARG